MATGSSPSPIDDVDRVRDVVAEVFCPHRLSVVESSRLDASFRKVTLSDVSLVWLRYGVGVRIGVDPPKQPFHIVQIPLAGEAVVESGKSTVRSTLAVASVPDSREACEMMWDSNCSQMIFHVPDDVLTRHLEALLGHPIGRSVHFSLDMDLRTPHGSSWRAMLDFAVSEVERSGGLLANSVVASQLEAMLLTGLLYAQEHNYSGRLHADALPATPRSIRRAREVIEAGASTPLTTESLALEVGVSARALQNGFRKHLECTPMAYLRSVRLQRVRDVLFRSDPSMVTVTEVAMAWGFAHLGRFSLAYRRKFGESPSQTLRT